MMPSVRGGKGSSMVRRILSLVVAAALVAGCAMQSAQRAAPGEPPDYGPSDEAIVAGGVATGAVLALIAVAAIAGTATLVFSSNP